MNTGVISIGVRCPIIRYKDNLVDIVIENVMKTLEENNMSLENKDVIGITESVVARAQGNYVDINEIAEFLTEKSYPTYIGLYKPIFSRNRFSVILKAFAKHCDKLVIYHSDVDEQGNPCNIPNPFTGVDIKEYYMQLCKENNCELEFESCYMCGNHNDGIFDIDARCHPEFGPSLLDIMTKPIVYEASDDDPTHCAKSGYNKDWGLLGSNKVDDKTLKLFPRKEEAQKLVDSIQKRLFNETGKWVEVLVYGDGCFKDPIGGIWEFADPVTCPAYTIGLEGTPNEIKLKAFADDKFVDLRGEELKRAIQDEIRAKDNNLVGNMASQGTTPRRYVDLLASLFDLTSGSGDKGTPVILCKNYFKNYSNE